MANTMNVNMPSVRALLQQSKNFVGKAVNGVNSISMHLSSLSEQISGGKGEKLRATIVSAQEIVRQVQENTTELSGYIDSRYNQLERIAEDSEAAHSVSSIIEEATAKYRDTNS